MSPTDHADTVLATYEAILDAADRQSAACLWRSPIVAVVHPQTLSRLSMVMGSKHGGLTYKESLAGHGIALVPVVGREGPYEPVVMLEGTLRAIAEALVQEGMNALCPPPRMAFTPMPLPQPQGKDVKA